MLQKTLTTINFKNLKNTGDGVQTCDNLVSIFF